MPGGRPPKRMRHVEDLRGPEEQKHRLRVVLETLSGERTVAEACAELEISEARFHELRRQALEAALEGLTPGRPGRPRTEGESSATPREVELERKVSDLEVDLQAALVRTELALAMPHLFSGKKNEPAAKVKKQRRRKRKRKG